MTVIGTDNFYVRFNFGIYGTYISACGLAYTTVNILTSQATLMAADLVLESKIQIVQPDMNEDFKLTVITNEKEEGTDAKTK